MLIFILNYRRYILIFKKNKIKFKIKNIIKYIINHLDFGGSFKRINPANKAYNAGFFFFDIASGLIFEFLLPQLVNIKFFGYQLYYIETTPSDNTHPLNVGSFFLVASKYGQIFILSNYQLLYPTGKV